MSHKFNLKNDKLESLLFTGTKHYNESTYDKSKMQKINKIRQQAKEKLFLKHFMFKFYPNYEFKRLDTLTSQNKSDFLIFNNLNKFTCELTDVSNRKDKQNKNLYINPLSYAFDNTNKSLNYLKENIISTILKKNSKDRRIDILILNYWTYPLTRERYKLIENGKYEDTSNKFIYGFKHYINVQLMNNNFKKKISHISQNIKIVYFNFKFYWKDNEQNLCDLYFCLKNET